MCFFFALLFACFVSHFVSSDFVSSDFVSHGLVAQTSCRTDLSHRPFLNSLSFYILCLLPVLTRTVLCFTMEILRHLEGKRLGIWKPEKVKELLMVTDRLLYRIDDYYDGLWIDTIGHGFCRRRRKKERARLTSRLLIKTLPPRPRRRSWSGSWTRARAPAPWYQPTLYFSYSSIIRERFHFAIEKGLSVGLREDVFLMLSSVATVQKFRPECIRLGIFSLRARRKIIIII